MSNVAPMAYEDALSAFDPLVVSGRHYSLRTRWLPAPGEEAWPLLIAAAGGFTTALTSIAVHHFHGAASRADGGDTAFAIRHDHMMAEVVTCWEPGDPGAPRHERWADDLSGALAPCAIPGGYPNLLGGHERDRTLLACQGNLTRLGELQRRFDPDGVFSTATGSTRSA